VGSFAIPLPVNRTTVKYFGLNASQAGYEQGILYGFISQFQY
jgi:hypothetical protein